MPAGALLNIISLEMLSAREGDLDNVLSALEEQSLAEARFVENDQAKTGRDDVLGILQRHGEKHAFSASQTVLQEGDASDSIMLLLSGWLDVSVARPQGKRRRSIGCCQLP